MVLLLSRDSRELREVEGHFQRLQLHEADVFVHARDAYRSGQAELELQLVQSRSRH